MCLPFCGCFSFSSIIVISYLEDYCISGFINGISHEIMLIHCEGQSAPL